MKNDKNNLPAKSSKIKRAIWLFLASIGIGSSIPNSTYAKAQDNTTVQNTSTQDNNYANTRNTFLESMKVDIPTQGAIDYKELTLNVVKDKCFDNVHNRNEYVQERISELFDAIRKNAPRFANLYGIEDTSNYTTDLEHMVYTQLNGLNDLIYSRSEDNDEYSERLDKKNGVHNSEGNFIIIKDMDTTKHISIRYYSS